MRYTLKDLSVDTDARTVHQNGTALKLPDLSFDVLVKLLEAAPDAVTTEAFCRDVWHAEHVSDETIAQRITLLRKALGDNPKEPTYIRTVRGSGYALVGSVAYRGEASSSGGFSFLKRYGLVSAGLALVLAVVLISYKREAEIMPVPVSAEVSPKSKTAILVERAQEQLNLHQARETDRSIAMLREALELDPGSFDARLTLSFALSTKTTKFGGGKAEEHEAEALARALISEQPEHSNAWSALAYALGSQGRIDESLSAYAYAYQLNPHNTPAISSAAHSHLVRGDLHRALQLEVQAKNVGGTSRYAEVQIAHALELIAHPATEEWYQRALSLNPGQVVVLSEAARSYMRRGNPAAALEVLAEAQGEDHFTPQIMELRGRAAIMLGDMGKAREYLEAAGKGGHFDRAALNALSGDMREAAALLLPEKLAEFEADTWPPTWVQFAEVAAASGATNQAIQFLTRAINLGWRDVNWLKQSPFLGALMVSDKGQQIESRIAQELELQRKLIEGNENLRPITGE